MSSCMKAGNCKVCREYKYLVHGETNVEGEFIGHCSACFETIDTMMKAWNIGFTEAQSRLRAALRRERIRNEEIAKQFKEKVTTSEDGTVVYRTVNYIPHFGKADPDFFKDFPTVTKVITAELYQELEYDVLDIDPDPDFDDPKEAVRYYRELIDAALAGGDYEWAGQLHKLLMDVQGKGQPK